MEYRKNRNFVEFQFGIDTKSKPPSGNIPCTTLGKPVSSAPCTIALRVQPRVGTCFKAASNIFVRTPSSLAFFSSSSCCVWAFCCCSNSFSRFSSLALNSSMLVPAEESFVDFVQNVRWSSGICNLKVTCCECFVIGLNTPRQMAYIVKEKITKIISTIGWR
ncbi:hypothetical protein FF38_11525 [Lucilia cuprina]|uniref:Uncharacterized protein n=1 Tax=Lucilia cuprina TaxID=7375 RepID=A0A0L0CDJ0_LUCCU|nr:hypothetical protein FF38_11525 [Lucilia cuprina]